MSDLVDFLGWLGLTLCCAVVVGYGLESFGANLEATQSLALGLCASFGAGSASYLLLRWLSPVLLLSRWLSRSINPGKTYSLFRAVSA
ncbi:hypothetical protein N9444_09750 [Gammaproteobacteria bacterium]|nr:hypothetical protein [Gammaproteobacteria bacterium]